MKKIIFIKTTLIFVLMVFFSIIIGKFGYAAYGSCIYGDESFGGDECLIVNKITGSAAGGGGGGITVPSTFTEVNLFGIEPDFINNQSSCKEKYQLFDGRCYPCDPARGYLKFNPDDRSVLCIECAEEFNGTGCVSTAVVNKKNIIYPFLLISILGILVIWRNKKKRAEEKVEELQDELDELEDEE